MKNILKKALTMQKACGIINKQSRDSKEKEKKTTKYGGIAQLGERLNGIQEVSGSIPLISTKTQKSEPVCCWQWVRIFRIFVRIGIGPGEGRTAAVSLRYRHFSIY